MEVAYTLGDKNHGYKLSVMIDKRKNVEVNVIDAESDTNIVTEVMILSDEEQLAAFPNIQVLEEK